MRLWTALTLPPEVAQTDPVNRRATAVLVVDLQHAFVIGPNAVPGADALMETVRALVDRARSEGVLVVHLQNDGGKGTPDEVGTPGWQLALASGPDDVVIRKSRDDGFRGTDLEAVLQSHDVSRLVICGLMSEMCVAETAKTALELGFEVWLPHDGHATYDVPPSKWHPESVPAETVSRVVEWQLGDQIHLVAHASSVEISN